MATSVRTPNRRMDARRPTQLRPLTLLLLSVAFGSINAPAEAEVAPRPPMISLSGAGDYATMSFVIYRIKRGEDPWATGNRVDGTMAIIVPADSAIDVPFYYEGCAVLAVPTTLVDKAKGVPDPAWLEPSAPGVIRVSGRLQTPSVYRSVTLRYQLEKGDMGPKWTLLNPEELKKAQQQPYDRADAEPSRSPTSWPQLARGALLVVAGILVGGLVAFCFLNRRNPADTVDSPG